MKSNDKKINPKGLKELLNEDPLLKRKVSYKELINSTKEGFDDTSIDECYKVYKKTISQKQKQK